MSLTPLEILERFDAIIAGREVSPTHLDRFNAIMSNDELPPPYEDGSISRLVPTIANVWRYSFISPASTNESNADTTSERTGSGRYVGRRVSSTKIPMLISSKTTFGEFVSSLADRAALRFGWHDKQVAYMIQLRVQKELFCVVTPAKWEVARDLVLSSTTWGKKRVEFVLLAAPVKEVGVWKKVQSLVLHLGRKMVGRELP